MALIASGPAEKEISRQFFFYVVKISPESKAQQAAAIQSQLVSEHVDRHGS